jgi:hypothetical protein
MDPAGEPKRVRGGVTFTIRNLRFTLRKNKMLRCDIFFHAGKPYFASCNGLRKLLIWLKKIFGLI